MISIQVIKTNKYSPHMKKDGAATGIPMMHMSVVYAQVVNVCSSKVSNTEHNKRKMFVEKCSIRIII